MIATRKVNAYISNARCKRIQSTMTAARGKIITLSRLYITLSLGFTAILLYWPKRVTTCDVYGAHVQPARVTGRRDKQMHNNKLLLNKRETSTGHQNPLQILLQLLINILGATGCRQHNDRLHQASIYYV